MDTGADKTDFNTGIKRVVYGKKVKLYFKYIINYMLRNVYNLVFLLLSSVHSKIIFNKQVKKVWPFSMENRDIDDKDYRFLFYMSFDENGNKIYLLYEI